MMARHLLLASMMVLGLVAVTTPANAVTLEWEIDVEVDTGSGFVAQGTASTAGSATTLIVSVSTGDTVRFIVGISASTALTSYSQAPGLDNDGVFMDVTEGAYLATANPNDNNLAGSGLNFANLSDPNNRFSGGASTGLIASIVGTSASTDLYFIDYVVGTPNSDGSVDFSVFGEISTTGFVDDISSGTASVRLDGSGAVVPEPATMLLLGSGLAGLAGFGRRKVRRR